MTTVILVATFVGIAIAVVGVWYARRAALASEEENDILKAQLTREDTRTKPKATIEVLKVEVVARGAADSDIDIVVSIENLSSVTETLREATVSLGDVLYARPPHSPALQPGSNNNAIPHQLAAGVPTKFAFRFRTQFRIANGDQLSGEFAAILSNAGEVRRPFVIEG